MLEAQDTTSSGLSWTEGTWLLLSLLQGPGICIELMEKVLLVGVGEVPKWLRALNAFLKGSLFNFQMLWPFLASKGTKYSCRVQACKILILIF